MKPFLTLLFVIATLAAFAQDEEGEKKFCKEIDNKAALKLYEKGTDKKKYPKPERLQYLKKCLEEEPDFAEANLAMARELIVHLQLENKSYMPTVPYFMKAIGSCPQIHSDPYYYIGFAYYEEMKNDSAVKYLEKYVKFKDDDDKKYSKYYEQQIYQSKEMIKQVKKEGNLKKKVVDFDPKVVRGISTERDEYLAYISPDDKNCFFVRKMPMNSKDVVYTSDKEKEVFMKAVRGKDGQFDKGDPMPWPFNEKDDNQGGCSITINNQFLYFSLCKFEGGQQANCDIYVSKCIDDEWKPFEKIGAAVNHPVYWDSQPTVSADGNSIIFASDRPGGFGGTDLYLTRRDASGAWGPPQNLGPKINTKGDERTPFIHSDSETLYFSSGDNQKTGGSGHYGFGGFDIFYSRKDEKGEWKEPENIGYPINSEGDDVGFFVSSDAKTGYFFAFDEGKVRGKGVGRYDLYSFLLYPEARPNEMGFLKGLVKSPDGEPYEGSRAKNLVVEGLDLATNKKTQAVVDEKTGAYMLAVKKDANVVLSVKDTKKSLAFTSAQVNVKEFITSAADPVAAKTIEMVTDSAKEGKSFVINNIYYNSNSAELKDESKGVLQAFADYLKDNPKMKIEIQGHTDNVGNASANQALSANRAFTIKSILESYGVKGDNVTAKGFGSSRPIADNSSETGRAKNRRTEFLILKSE